MPPALAALVRQPGQSRHDCALPRALPQFWADARRTDRRQADHRHRADRIGPVAVQPASSRIGQTRTRRHPHRGWHRVRVSDASDPGNRQAADRCARPQSGVSRPRRSAVRLSARRRGADDRLRQDHAGGADGGGDGQPPGHRAVGRADAQRLVEGRTLRFRHRAMEGTAGARRRQDRLPRVHRDGRLVRAVGRSLQHHGHRLHHECARRGARHEPARLRRHPGALSRTGPDCLRDRYAGGRDRARGPQAVEHPHAPGLRECHRRQLGDRRLDQRAHPYQRDRAPRRRRA